MTSVNLDRWSRVTLSTLQTAYNNGNTITTSYATGAPEITVPDAENMAALIVRQQDATNPQNAVEIYNNSAGAALAISGTGSRYVATADGTIGLLAQASNGSSTTTIAEVRAYAVGTSSANVQAKLIAEDPTGGGGVSQVVIDAGDNGSIDIGGTTAYSSDINIGTTGAHAIQIGQNGDGISTSVDILGRNQDHQWSVINGAILLETNNSGDITIDSDGELIFSDENQFGSTYSTDLNFSDTTGEWDNFVSNFGEVSLLNAISQALTGGATLQTSYDGGNTIATSGGNAVALSATTDQDILTIISTAATPAATAPFTITHASIGAWSQEFAGAGRRGTLSRDADVYHELAGVSSSDSLELTTQVFAATAAASTSTGLMQFTAGTWSDTSTSGNQNVNLRGINSNSSSTSNMDMNIKLEQSGLGHSVIDFYSDIDNASNSDESTFNIWSTTTGTGTATLNEYASINNGANGGNATASFYSETNGTGDAVATIRANQTNATSGNDATLRLDVDAAYGNAVCYIDVDTPSGGVGNSIIYLYANSVDQSSTINMVATANTASEDASITIAADSTSGTGTLALRSQHDVNITARGSLTAFNESGDTSLDTAFTAASVIGGLNELKADLITPGAETKTGSYSVSLPGDSNKFIALYGGTTATFTLPALSSTNTGTIITLGNMQTGGVLDITGTGGDVFWLSGLGGAVSGFSAGITSLQAGSLVRLQAYYTGALNVWLAHDVSGRWFETADDTNFTDGSQDGTKLAKGLTYRQFRAINMISDVDQSGSVPTASATGDTWVVNNWGGDHDASTWQATTAYLVGDFVTSSEGDSFECTTAGTSGGTEPAGWADPSGFEIHIGDTTNDGTVVWTRRGDDGEIWQWNGASWDLVQRDDSGEPADASHVVVSGVTSTAGAGSFSGLDNAIMRYYSSDSSWRQVGPENFSIGYCGNVDEQFGHLPWVYSQNNLWESLVLSHRSWIRRVDEVDSGSYTVDSDITYEALHVTYTSTGAVTITLNTTWINIDGATITIKDTGLSAGTNNITINTQSTQTIDGSASLTLSSNGDSVTLQAFDGDVYVI